MSWRFDEHDAGPERQILLVINDVVPGGRFRCEMTDVDPDAVAIGDRVEMTFRKISTVAGVHNYFWKAKPSKGDS